MDFEGIAWAGNIYQKFDAMCLEVEEDMYQDTIKYFENQVQIVGSTVKKFYSEVVQDILRQDYVDPVKVSDLPLNPYSHTEVIKKPTITMMKRDVQNLKKKTEESKVVGDIKAGHKETVAIDHAKCDIGLRAFSNSYSGTGGGAGLYRHHSVNSKGNYKIDTHSKMSKETNFGSEILTEATSFCQLSILSSDVKHPDVKTTRSLDHSVCMSTAIIGSPASSLNLPNDIEQQSLVISPENSDSDNEKPAPARMESKTYRICGSVVDESFFSCKGSGNSKIDAGSNDIEQEIFERLDESKFEEACVLVEGNDKIQVVPHKKGKPKSCSFPLRTKSTSKQEYEMLAAQCSVQSSKQEDIEQYVVDVAGSEWELL